MEGGPRIHGPDRKKCMRLTAERPMADEIRGWLDQTIIYRSGPRVLKFCAEMKIVRDIQGGACNGIFTTHIAARR